MYDKSKDLLCPSRNLVTEYIRSLDCITQEMVKLVGRLLHHGGKL